MTTAVSSLCRKNPHAPCEEQMPYWVEFQLVDEQGDPVANMPWTVESAHPVSGPVEGFTYSGQSDADGLIRVDMPHGLELRLTFDGNQLATEMEKRALRVSRDAENDSIVRPEAEEKGYIWHYAVIGELCRTLPPVELRDILLDELAVIFAKNSACILDHKLPLKSAYHDASVQNDMLSDALDVDVVSLKKRQR